MKLNELLGKMKGKTFFYRQREITIVGYKISGDRVTIATESGEWLEWENGQAEKEIREFRAIHANNRSLALPIPENKFVDLADVIIRNIEKVENDPAYIKQAHAVNQSVTTLINMAKLGLSIQRAKKNDL